MSKKQAVQDAITALKEEQMNEDIEMSHVNADDILCKLISDLGYPDVAHEFNRIQKWYA